MINRNSMSRTLSVIVLSVCGLLCGGSVSASQNDEAGDVAVMIVIGQSNADGSAMFDPELDSEMKAWYESPANPRKMKIWYRSSKVENQASNALGEAARWVVDGDTADERFMDEIVEMLALEDKLNNMPNNLSGGQQQRVAIARALITKPAIILADEPTGNLDSRTSADVLGLLKRTSMEFNQTIVMITHNNEIAQLADRIVRIEDGRIVGGGRQARSAFKMPSDDLPSNASEGAQPCKGGRQARRDLGKPSDEMLPGTGKRALPRRGGGRS